MYVFLQLFAHVNVQEGKFNGKSSEKTVSSKEEDVEKTRGGLFSEGLYKVWGVVPA